MSSNDSPHSSHSDDFQALHCLTSISPSTNISAYNNDCESTNKLNGLYRDNCEDTMNDADGMNAPIGSRANRDDSTYSCGKCLPRCIAHCHFFAMCCSYIVVSSLPRLLLGIDIVSSLIFYTALRGSLPLFVFVQNDIKEHSFKHSASDLMLLALIRTIILFVCFAYRNQTVPRYLFVARFVHIISILYIVAKFFFGAQVLHSLAISNLISVAAQKVVYWLVRRRRIVAPAKRFLCRDSYERIESSSSTDHIAHSILTPLSVNDEILRETDSLFININGINIHYRLHTHSDSHRPLIILLHGFGAGLFSFRQCWNSLQSLGSVLAFDRPGCALSSVPSSMSTYDFSSQADIHLTCELLQALSLSSQSLIIVGHSTGAALAASIAVNRPERVRAIVLTSLGAGLPRVVRSLFASRLGGAVALQLARSELTELTVKRSWHSSNVSSNVIERYRASVALLCAGRGDSLVALVRAGRNHDSETVLDICSKIRCPTLIVTGDDDRLVPSAHTRHVYKAVPHAKMVTVASCGHLPHEERNHIFVKTLNAFIAHLEAHEASVSISMV